MKHEQKETWTICPFEVGQIYIRDGMLHGGGSMKDVDRIKKPAICFLLINNTTNEKILVDAGPKPDAYMTSLLHNPYVMVQTIENGLKRFQTTKEEISKVILTHLHWDHAWGAVDLPNAKIILQKSELLFALNPSEKHVIMYESGIDVGEMPYVLQLASRYEVVDGDVELENGLQLYLVGGHTTGSQIIIVPTDNGTYLIMGDNVYDYESFQARKAPENLLNEEEWQVAMNKIYEVKDKLDAKILIAHDYGSFDELGIRYEPFETLKVYNHAVFSVKND